ncbi:HD domain-containing protein, partial [Candidatus Peregrinibacteria bacterium]|nr:HD domain-containing protein [Candidatus Peregrinibacteria bacterium]
MTSKEILKIYQEFHVPKHIIRHMKMVAFVCKKIIKKLTEKNIKIDGKNVINAALLHDVIRYVDFKTLSQEDPALWQKLRRKYHKIGHEKGMAEILRKRGEKKLANLIAKHGFFPVWNLKTLEEKILYYADKRVDKDKIVDLKTRFIEGKKRNASPQDDAELVAATEKKVETLEQELQTLLGGEFFAKGNFMIYCG